MGNYEDLCPSFARAGVAEQDVVSAQQLSSVAVTEPIEVPPETETKEQIEECMKHFSMHKRTPYNTSDEKYVYWTPESCAYDTGLTVAQVERLHQEWLAFAAPRAPAVDPMEGGGEIGGIGKAEVLP